MNIKSLSIKIMAATAIVVSGISMGCNKAGDDDKRPSVGVSIEPQRYILEKIAGDDVDIFTLMPNGENPETYDPTANNIRQVADADMYFSIGYLLFEGNLKMNSSIVTDFVDVSEGIEPIFGTHGDGEGEVQSKFLPGGEKKRLESDPHIWTSVKNAKVIAANMAEGMARLIPDRADVYRERADRYVAHLDSLDEAIAEALDTVSIKAFMVWHPSLSYFARDYGFDQIAVGHEAKEPSVGGMRDIIDMARNEKIKAFFFQKNIDSRNAEAVGAAVDADMVAINPLDYDWEANILNVAGQLAK